MKAIILRYSISESEFRRVIKGIMGQNYDPEISLELRGSQVFQRKIQNTLVAGIGTSFTRVFGGEEFEIPIVIKLHRDSASRVECAYFVSDGTLAIRIPNALRMHVQEVLDVADMVLGGYDIQVDPVLEML